MQRWTTISPILFKFLFTASLHYPQKTSHLIVPERPVAGHFLPFVLSWPTQSMKLNLLHSVPAVAAKCSILFLAHSFLVLGYMLCPVLMILKSMLLAQRSTASLAAVSMPRLSQPAPYSHSNLWAFGWVPVAQTKGSLPRSPTCYPVNKEPHIYSGPSPLTAQRQSCCLNLALQQVCSLFWICVASPAQDASGFLGQAGHMKNLKFPFQQFVRHMQISGFKTIEQGLTTLYWKFPKCRGWIFVNIVVNVWTQLPSLLEACCLLLLPFSLHL